MTEDPMTEPAVGGVRMDRRRFVALSAASATTMAWSVSSLAQAGEERVRHVAIIGAGVFGMTTAWHLVRRGVRVSLIDPAPGQGCTQGSFAMIIATQPEGDAAFNALYTAAIAEWHRFQSDLGPAMPVQWGGIVNWAPPGERAAELEATRSKLVSWGADAQAIGRADIARLCPGALAGDFGGGYFVPDQGAVDIDLLMRTLSVQLMRAGCRFIRDRVDDIRFDAAGKPVLSTPAGPVAANRVVLAGGAANTAMAAKLGARVPLDLLSGTLARSRPLPPVLHRVLNGPMGSIKQNPDGRIVTGLDYKPGSSNLEIGAAYGRLLLDTAARTLPALKAAQLEAVVHGAVPIPARDKMPVVGALPRSPNAYVINAMSGVTVSPLLARLAATEIVDGLRLEALSPYRPERFDTAA